MTNITELADILSAAMDDRPCDECLGALIYVMAATMSQLSEGAYEQELVENASKWLSESYKWHTSAEAVAVTAKINLN